MRRNEDVLWKGITEEVFDDLLRFILPDADHVLDMKRGFEFMDKELAKIYPEPDKNANTRYADKLVKVFRKNGMEEWILCHIEIQGQTKAKDRPQFGERMFRYYYRIFDRYQKPITAIAIFTAEDGKRMPDRYEYRFLGTSHTYQYNTYRITDPANEELAASDNPFAMVVLAAKTALLSGKIPELALVDQKSLVARLLLSKKKFSRRKIDMILSFLNNYVLFDKQETNLIFMDTLDQYTGKKNTMGLIERLAEIREEEGREKGFQEAQKKTVLKLLASNEFPVSKIADLVGEPISFVEKIKESLQSNNS